MNIGRVASLLMFTAAVVGAFAEIPIISDYAFWLLVGAYLIWLGVHRRTKSPFKLGLTVSNVLTLVAILGVFVEIPIVSDYAFWVMAAAYVVVFSVTG